MSRFSSPQERLAKCSSEEVISKRDAVVALEHAKDQCIIYLVSVSQFDTQNSGLPLHFGVCVAKKDM